MAIVAVGAVVNGNTITDIGPFTDINNGGNVVFWGRINDTATRTTSGTEPRSRRS